MSVLENFKNIPRSPYGGATGLKCNFFFQICNEVLGVKKRGGPIAPPTGDRGDRGLSPVGGATGPPLFFLQGLRCKFEEKKLHLSPVAPPRATGVYF